MPPTKVANGNNRSTPPSTSWQIVIMAVAVVATLAGQFWSIANPREDIKQTRDDFHNALDAQAKDFREQLDRLTTDIHNIRVANDAAMAEVHDRLRHDYLTSSEHNEFKTREDARITQLENFVNKIDDKEVSRAENIEHWNEVDKSISNQKERIDQLQKDFSSSFSIGDQLKQLQKEIDDLRQAISNNNYLPPQSQGSPITISPTPLAK